MALACLAAAVERQSYQRGARTRIDAARRGDAGRTRRRVLFVLAKRHFIRFYGKARAATLRFGALWHFVALWRDPRQCSSRAAQRRTAWRGLARAPVGSASETRANEKRRQSDARLAGPVHVQHVGEGDDEHGDTHTRPIMCSGPVADVSSTELLLLCESYAGRNTKHRGETGK